METNTESKAYYVQEIFEKCLGCKWTLHVLAKIREGIFRPGQLERTAEGLTTKVLNERLTKLVNFGVLQKHSFPEIPPRVEYRLTEFGEEFVSIVDQINELQHRYQKDDKS